jgi:hypothetical protein
MTRQGTYIVTAVAVVMFLLLNWAFADGLFAGTFWDSKDIANSVIWTYVLLALIVLAGVLQAQRLPADGISTRLNAASETPGQLHDPQGWQLIMGNVYWSLFWLPIRFFIGREWVAASEHKLRDDAWMKIGVALQGFGGVRSPCRSRVHPGLPTAGSVIS